MIRVPFADLWEALRLTLIPLGFTSERATECARLFAETTRDGVYTHGLSRFPRFAAMVKAGIVNPEASPSLVHACGGIERWHGHRGPGNLNAWMSMERAVELARLHGIGCVALAQTNHWMRGGTYGWQAADLGCIALCFTNTLPNLPAWGAKQPVLGNNPLVLAVPRAHGAHVVLDMAMSQFSYGTLSAFRDRGEALPFTGGWSKEGELTTDPKLIEESGRALPVGMWKGSGLAMVLDLVAAMLSGGLLTRDIDHSPEHETGLSQVFIAINPACVGDRSTLSAIADAAVASLHSAEPIDAAHPPRYPGEHTLQLREENLRLGVPVDETIWATLERGFTAAS